MTAGSLALANAARGGAVGWIVPTYRNARPLWRFVERHATGFANLRRSEMTAEFGRGHLTIYTADNDIGIRGEAFDLVVVDEAARIKEETYTDAIMPTLADRNGKAILISTPKGRNWFWREFERGRSDGKYQASFTAPSAANPMPQIRQAARMAKERVSARTYQQEWLAEFVSDGSFFVNVEMCATAAPQSAATAGHDYVIGVDWARAAGGDNTAFVVVDINEQSAVNATTHNGKSFEFQLRSLVELYDRFGQPRIIAEQNSMGAPLVERLLEAGLPVTPFVTSAASKHDIMIGLELAFDKKSIRIIPDEALKGELLAYEKKERAGLPSYSAPEGMRDDTVMALALAWHGASALPVSAFAL